MISLQAELPGKKDCNVQRMCWFPAGDQGIE